MLDLVGNLIRNLVLLLFVVVLLELLMPQGQFNRYLRMVAGLMVILMILTFTGNLLGRFPMEISLAALAEQSSLIPEIRGTELWQLNRQQALQIYHDGLIEMVCRIIAETGTGQVDSVRLDIETDENSPQYGAVLGLEVIVKQETLPVKDERSPPVLVKPILVKPFQGAEETRSGNNETGCRLPDLEKTLSDRLQLPAALIVVRENL